MQTSTPNRPSGPLLEEKSYRTLDPMEIVEESEEPSWYEAAQLRLLKSEQRSRDCSSQN